MSDPTTLAGNALLSDLMGLPPADLWLKHVEAIEAEARAQGAAQSDCPVCGLDHDLEDYHAILDSMPIARALRRGDDAAAEALVDRLAALVEAALRMDMTKPPMDRTEAHATLAEYRAYRHPKTIVLG
jgi:hypothetical protein